jgi:ABC-type lipoprotein export system ATPase subunit
MLGLEGRVVSGCAASCSAPPLVRFSRPRATSSHRHVLPSVASTAGPCGGRRVEHGRTVACESSTHVSEVAEVSTHAEPSTSGVDSDVLIEFQNVHKAFGDNVILRGCTFKIRRGEAVGIIGASGTGKSTTLRIAAGLLAPDSGNVLILGKHRTGLLSDQRDDSGEEHLRVGMVFQNAALFDSLDVGANVGFLLYEHSQLEPEKIKAIVKDSLAKVGLRGVEGLYPSELSGGMKKRVALARCACMGCMRICARLEGTHACAMRHASAHGVGGRVAT